MVAQEMVRGTYLHLRVQRVPQDQRVQQVPVLPEQSVRRARRVRPEIREQQVPPVQSVRLGQRDLQERTASLPDRRGQPEQQATRARQVRQATRVRQAQQVRTALWPVRLARQEQPVRREFLPAWYRPLAPQA
jgi:hypothetical protein